VPSLDLSKVNEYDMANKFDMGSESDYEMMQMAEEALKEQKKIHVEEKKENFIYDSNDYFSTESFER
jgi:hypothetical protein